MWIVKEIKPLDLFRFVILQKKKDLDVFLETNRGYFCPVKLYEDKTRSELYIGHFANSYHLPNFYQYSMLSLTLQCNEPFSAT